MLKEQGMLFVVIHWEDWRADPWKGNKVDGQLILQ